MRKYLVPPHECFSFQTLGDWQNVANAAVNGYIIADPTDSL
jgi:hypothetical protein